MSSLSPPERYSPEITSTRRSNKEHRRHISLNCRRSDHTSPRISAHTPGSYAPWCGYCQQLQPIWKGLENQLAKDPSVRIGEVNCDEQFGLCKLFDIPGFPILKLYMYRLLEQERKVLTRIGQGSQRRKYIVIEASGISNLSAPLRRVAIKMPKEPPLRLKAALFLLIRA